MSNDIRERAKQILSVVSPLRKQINSVGATADLFTKLTGKTQAQLQSNWDGGGIMTTCNEFVGRFGTQLGSTKYLGRFDQDEHGAGLGQCDNRSLVRLGHGGKIRQSARGHRANGWDVERQGTTHRR